MEVVGLSEEQMGQLKRLLMDFRNKSGASLVVLAHISGQIVGFSSNRKLPVDAMAALMAGIFSAVQELFSLSGLSGANTVLMEGSGVSVYAFKVSGDTFAFVLYPTDEVRFGVLKLHVSQFRKKILPIVESMDVSRAVGDFLSGKVPEEVVEKADRPPERESLDDIISLLKKEIEEGLSE